MSDICLLVNVHGLLEHIAVVSTSVVYLRKRRARNHSRANGSLEEQTLAYLETNGATSVHQLYGALRASNAWLTEEHATDLVWRLVDQRKADLKDMPPTVDSLQHYLRLWERNLWFYTSLALSFATMAAIYVLPASFPFVVLRWVLGSLFIIFIPGYVAVEALFPRVHDSDWVERFAYSVGASLAFVTLIGLLLNSSWGIRVTPVVVSLTVFTIALSLVALGRRYRLSARTFAVA
jgi:ABC-type multidrug transport system fused ATPase/permease subunit